MHFIDLSHRMRDGQPSFPGDPVLSTEPHATIEKQRCNVTKIAMGSHQGTHLDALYHFIPDGRRIDEMPLDWFYGPATVLRIPKPPRAEIVVDDFKPFAHHLVPGARIIYETGWHQHYGKADYFTDFPSLARRKPQRIWLERVSGCWAWTLRHPAVITMRSTTSFYRSLRRLSSSSRWPIWMNFLRNSLSLGFHSLLKVATAHLSAP